MTMRPYDPDRDRPAAHRLWRECGWFEPPRTEEGLNSFVEAGRGMVAEVSGEPECLVITCPGVIRHLDDDLPLACVTGVTTGRVARKQGLAKALLARLLAVEAVEGTLVSVLGIFDQGFYNRLGFGTGGYEHHFRFDPARLRVGITPRIPRRLTLDDSDAAHAARLARYPVHGRCSLLPAAITRAEMGAGEKAFGLGYFDGPNGELTHYLWCDAHGGEHGPYRVTWLVYRNREQLLELVALIGTLGDQVRLIEMREPSGIQLQDLLDRPFQQIIATEQGKYASRVEAWACWQARLLHLPGCLARTHLPWTDLRFSLHLTDPIEALLDESAPWHGVAGDHVVTLGAPCHAEPGADASLPTLSASVNAFTRLWLGVLPATSLAITDDLSAPSPLLHALDHAFRLPQPHPDWDF